MPCRLIFMAGIRTGRNARKYFAKRRLRDSDHAMLLMPRAKSRDFFKEMRPLGDFSKIIDNWTAV
jgi:hypothetical protein